MEPLSIGNRVLISKNNFVQIEEALPVRGSSISLIYLKFSIADKVLATLGEGTFGKVVKVKDMLM